MYGQYFQHSMDQPGMVSNPACGQLNRKYIGFFPVPVRAREIRLARRIRPFRLASARSFSTLREFPPAFRDGVYTFDRHRVSPEFIRPCNCVPMLFTTTAAGSGLVVLKVAPVRGVAFSGFRIEQLFCASLFSHPLFTGMYRTYV